MVSGCGAKGLGVAEEVLGTAWGKNAYPVESVVPDFYKHQLPPKVSDSYSSIALSNSDCGN